MRFTPEAVAALACAAFPPAFASEDAETRRARKEAFHSGNAGTTFLEVSAVVAAALLIWAEAAVGIF